ncbi:unnamed protein product [Chironomus riparius]|uniref:Uncharacterized protein n=1 Tax=Chironomus riparius TaxID=315576 RepID=A0A9N9RVM1_9DIPT|nr:unnamed protein product [Chironomus riparius]
MKLLFLVIVILCGVQYSVQEPLEGDDTSIMDCVMNAADELGLDRIQGGAEWLIELRFTVEDLVNGRRRCQEMTNDRLRDACMITWRAQVLIEAARLASDLRTITNDEDAQQFYNDFLACFGVEPSPDDPPYPPVE